MWELYSSILHFGRDKLFMLPLMLYIFLNASYQLIIVLFKCIQVHGLESDIDALCVGPSFATMAVSPFSLLLYLDFEWHNPLNFQ